MRSGSTDEVVATMQLNGWQRLLIVLAVIYLVPVTGMMSLFWPTAATTWHRDEFIAQMPAELRAKVDGAYDSKWKWEEAWKKRVIPSDDATAKASKGKNVSPPRPPGFVLLSAPVSFPNGAVLDVHVAKEGDPEPDARVGPAYWALVEAEARAARWTMVWQMALV